jgi:hypothetical protein
MKSEPGRSVVRTSTSGGVPISVLRGGPYPAFARATTMRAPARLAEAPPARRRQARLADPKGPPYARANFATCS